MEDIIEMGTISSRGQISIPSDIRKEMNLKEGTKILFLLSDDSLLVKKVNAESFGEITRPLKEAAKKAGFKESEVTGIIQRHRSKK
ncbi:MAG TPA: AbrB/MazE/SpoVT family DNA-binding domain-containing protein [Candidatus Nanoarchaeia archaeon]|nr:AbrB/MazE/SpoVT family DNA-binding domain-containing protein [Candidatus Nanoarchaeia archaeon]